MSVKQTPAVKSNGRYNPNAIRRCVRRDASQPKGISTFTTKSFTRADGIEHHPAIDLETGEVRCTCEHFRFRLAPTAAKCDAVPTIKTAMLHCKHLERAIENSLRAGELVRDESKVLHLAGATETVTVQEKLEFDYVAFFED